VLRHNPTPAEIGTALAASAAMSGDFAGKDMEHVDKSIDVDSPLRAVYNQWTQFEDFPYFMTGVKTVRQLDPTHVRWHVEVWGKDQVWDAEITEQVPDERISWKSISGPANAGTVRFEALEPQLTRVRLAMAYEPKGLVENVGDALGIISARVQRTLDDFKKFIERRGGDETGAWRGRVHDSQTVPGRIPGGKTPR
jgi:uncharacterized membrane protein